MEYTTEIDGQNAKKIQSRLRLGASSTSRNDEESQCLRFDEYQTDNYSKKPSITYLFSLYQYSLSASLLEPTLFFFFFISGKCRKSHSLSLSLFIGAFSPQTASISFGFFTHLSPQSRRSTKWITTQFRTSNEYCFSKIPSDQSLQVSAFWTCFIYGEQYLNTRKGRPTVFSRFLGFTVVLSTPFLPTLSLFLSFFVFRNAFYVYFSHSLYAIMISSSF